MAPAQCVNDADTGHMRQVMFALNMGIGKNRISVTLTVARLLVPEGLV